MSEASASTDQVSALALAPFSNGDTSIIKYALFYYQTGYFLFLPTLQWAIVGRYRSRSDAEGHLQLFRQRVPNIRFEIVFDLPHPQG